MLLRKMQRGKHIKSEAATFKLSIPKSQANDVKALKVCRKSAFFMYHASAYVKHLWTVRDASEKYARVFTISLQRF